jgi:hypothetical protein
MSEYAKQKSLYADVQRALWTEWDPIGVRSLGGPADEYNGYAAAVLHELNSGSGEIGLARLLQQFETEHMGLEPRSLNQVLEAARRIRTVIGWTDPPR